MSTDEHRSGVDNKGAGRGAALVYDSIPAKARSHLAANTKSLSVRPLILWVQIVTPTRPQANERSG